MPELFFPLLMRGATLVDAYYRSLPFFVLAAGAHRDPLYRAVRRGPAAWTAEEPGVGPNNR